VKPANEEFPDPATARSAIRAMVRAEAPVDYWRAIPAFDWSPGCFSSPYYAFNTSMKASCGMLTEPNDFIRFLPSFCFSNSLRLRVMSPP
jgi:hypothetical protein